MEKPVTTYPVRMGCDNCGHMDYYEVPHRQQIDEYDRGKDNFSAYHRINTDKVTILACKYCKLPHLKVFWWKDEEEAMHPNEVTQ